MFQQVRERYQEAQERAPHKEDTQEQLVKALFQNIQKQGQRERAQWEQLEDTHAKVSQEPTKEKQYTRAEPQDTPIENAKYTQQKG